MSILCLANVYRCVLQQVVYKVHMDMCLDLCVSIDDVYDLKAFI